MNSIMVLLGRLNAVTDVATGENTSWALAQHHEIVESDAGVFDPMEPGRIDWNATTVLVRHCC
jgi:hypothetical protein